MIAILNTHLLIAVAASLLLLCYLGFNHFRQRRHIRQLSQLAKSLEESKAQIIQQQQLNRRLKQEMTSNIAHELKTPVSSIRGYLEILLGDKPVDDEKRHYFLQRCYSQTLRLSDLINDVSLINKLEESSDLFPKETVSVKAIADEAVLELEEACRSVGLVVDNTLPEAMVICGNHSLLYCIFRNLLENVIMHAGRDIKAVIECYKEDDTRYFLHFYDTGVGVDANYLPRLFDRFLRINEGRSRRTGGTGLGLSIVKHAVIFHGGEIYVRNRELGGLEFFFSLNKK